jgi:hypothetical protein
MAYCSQCGANVQDGSKFCPNCGAALQPAEPNAAPEPDKSFYDANPAYGGNPAGAPDNGGYPPYGGGFRANIKRRDIAVAVVLSIVTCGIYAIIWLYNVITDMNTALPRPDDKDPVTVILLTIVTCGIYGLIWVYHAGEKVDQIRQMNGEAPSNSSVLYLVLGLVGLSIVSTCLIQTELNKIALYE